MVKQQKKGLVRLYYASIYSYKGFVAGWRNEASVRQELIVAMLLTVAAFFVGQSLSAIMLLVLMPWLTVGFELLNSAIEAVVDRIGPELHELSGRAKDFGSAAVFVTLVLNVLIWGSFLGQRLGLWG